jgi:DNA-binding MarR family transcriptional regulator
VPSADPYLDDPVAERKLCDVLSTAPMTSHTSYLIYRAGALMLAEVERRLAGFRLTGRRYFLLTALTGAVALSQQEISVLLAMDPGSVCTLVDELEERGLLMRRRNPVDRRRNELLLTGEGRDLVAEATVTVAEIEQDFLQKLDPDERKALQDSVASTLVEALPPEICPL